jgi:hypothetical protein
MKVAFLKIPFLKANFWRSLLKARQPSRSHLICGGKRECEPHRAVAMARKAILDSLDDQNDTYHFPDTNFLLLISSILSTHPGSFLDFQLEKLSWWSGAPSEWPPASLTSPWAHYSQGLLLCLIPNA